MRNLEKTVDALYSGARATFLKAEQRQAVMIALVKKYKLHTSQLVCGRIGGNSYQNTRNSDVFTLSVKK